MRIRIYQINNTRDSARVIFAPLDLLEKYQGSKTIDSSIYDRVYDGEVPAENLEDIYRIFNIEHPEDFYGHSLSVSDVVEIVDNTEDSGFYFCDSFGFKRIDFNASEASTFDSEYVVGLLLTPMHPPRTMRMHRNESEFERLVEGKSAVSTPFGDKSICAVSNAVPASFGHTMYACDDNGTCEDLRGRVFVCQQDADGNYIHLSAAAREYVVANLKC